MNSVTPALMLYRFRYCDTLTGKWRDARYHATKDEIAAPYKDFDLLGQPEVQEPKSTEPFNRFRRSASDLSFDRAPRARVWLRRAELNAMLTRELRKIPGL